MGKVSRCTRFKLSAELHPREEIGVLTSLPLLRKIVEDLEAARNSGDCSLNLYFTKESHIHTLLNLVLASGLPIVTPKIPELDYCVCSPSGSKRWANIPVRTVASDVGS
jgi:hypothetical protein